MKIEGDSLLYAFYDSHLFFLSLLRDKTSRKNVMGIKSGHTRVEDTLMRCLVTSQVW